jgi:hypothetical protein
MVYGSEPFTKCLSKGTIRRSLRKTARLFYRVSYMRRVRASIPRRVGSVAPLAALVLISAGLVFLADGSIIVGCAILFLSIPGTWLAGLWAVPNSVDAYTRKMTNLLRGDFADAVWEGGQRTQLMRARTATIVMLKPPQKFEDFHGRTIRVLREIDDLGNDNGPTLVERTNKMNDLRQQLARAREEIAGSPEPYLGELAQGLDARMALENKSADAVLRPLRHQGRVLARINVPKSWHNLHNAYTLQFNAYLVALESYCDVRNNGPVPNRIACSLEDQKEKLNDLVGELRTALWDYHSGA